MTPETGRLEIELVGDLAALLNLAADGKRPGSRDCRAFCADQGGCGGRI